MFLFPDPHLSEAQKRRETKEDKSRLYKTVFRLNIQGHFVYYLLYIHTISTVEIEECFIENKLKRSL